MLSDQAHDEMLWSLAGGAIWAPVQR